MKSATRKTIMIDGVRYYAERPHDCRKCFFWKNRKVGCTLGRENCYYLAEVIKTEQEKKCENCPYAKGQPCVSASCYKDLEKWLQERRARTVRKMMKEGVAAGTPRQNRQKDDEGRRNRQCLRKKCSASVITRRL